MKKFLSRACAAALAASMCTGGVSTLAAPSNSASRINVEVFGKNIAFPDAEPFIDENSRTLVPLRAIGNALGLDVKWNDSARTATFSRGVDSVIFTINQSKYEIVKSGSTTFAEMDTKAIISEERTYAPARYLAEAFEFFVGWEADSKTVIIREQPSGEKPHAETPETNENELFAKLKEPFDFSSGAGGWGTELKINADGSFEGNFHDSEMGSTGEGYPYGSMYVSNFSGHFKNLKKVNDYTYSMDLADIGYKDEVGKEEIIDEIKYIYSTAYGLAGAKTVLIFTPDAPVSELPEEFKDWIFELRADPTREKLGFYGLYNVEEQEGFSSANK